MAIGTYKREFPRGIVRRGWDPQNPTTISIALPVATDTATGSQYDIKQGMLISPDSTGTKWIRGVAAGDKPDIVAFSQHDSYDFDVLDAKKLVGLPCYGKYRFATPFFVRKSVTSAGAAIAGKDANHYKAGTPLTYATNDEYTEFKLVVDGVLTSKHRSASGYVRPAATGEVVIGVVSTTFTGVNACHSGVTGDFTGAWALQKDIGTAEDSSSKMHNAYFIEWDCTHAPAAPTA